MDSNSGGYSSPVSVPPPPSIGQSISEYLAALPQIYSAEQQYGPQFAQLQYDLGQRFYPYTSGLQEQLARQSAEGISAGVPDWMRQEYISNLRAASGENVGSPIAADYESTGLLRLGEDYRNYFRNLGLSLTGRLPLTQGQNVAMGGIPSALNYGSQNYGNYVSGLVNQPFGYHGGQGSRFGGALQGAAGGALAGSPFGPPGMIIGGSLGSLGGYFR